MFDLPRIFDLKYLIFREKAITLATVRLIKFLNQPPTWFKSMKTIRRARLRFHSFFSARRNKHDFWRSLLTAIPSSCPNVVGNVFHRRTQASCFWILKEHDVSVNVRTKELTSLGAVVGVENSANSMLLLTSRRVQQPGSKGRNGNKKTSYVPRADNRSVAFAKFTKPGEYMQEP